MPKKKTPTVLYISSPGSVVPTMVTMNRKARRMYPNNPTQMIRPVKKDKKGD